jgi:hypothetical protein
VGNSDFLRKRGQYFQKFGYGAIQSQENPQRGGVALRPGLKLLPRWELVFFLNEAIYKRSCVD